MSYSIRFPITWMYENRRLAPLRHGVFSTAFIPQLHFTQKYIHGLYITEFCTTRTSITRLSKTPAAMSEAEDKAIIFTISLSRLSLFQSTKSWGQRLAGFRYRPAPAHKLAPSGISYKSFSFHNQRLLFDEMIMRKGKFPTSAMLVLHVRVCL